MEITYALLSYVCVEESPTITTFTGTDHDSTWWGAFMEMTAIQGDLTEQGRAVRKIDGVTPLGIETVVYGKL